MHAKPAGGGRRKYGREEHRYQWRDDESESDYDQRLGIGRKRVNRKQCAILNEKDEKDEPTPCQSDPQPLYRASAPPRRPKRSWRHRQQRVELVSRGRG